MDRWIIYLLIAIIMLLLLYVAITLLKTKKSQHDKPKCKQRYDARGFDHNHIHKNGTRYDDDGFDFYGFDANGYGRNGYNVHGKNVEGQYDRLHDTTSGDEEGFWFPSVCSVSLTDHAKLRFRERLGIDDSRKMLKFAVAAYQYGRSKRQIKKTSAYLVEEIEMRYDNSIVLIHKGYIYVFTPSKVLKTVFKNERIPL